MAKHYHKSNQQSQPAFRVNERIRFSPVLVIDEKGQNLGAIPVEEARTKARNVGLDLVEISPTSRPPVCRIMDFGKFKYEQGMKEKKQKQNSKNTQTKEVRLSPRIASHDVETKANAAAKFLKAGHKVQLRLEYKRRENAHKDLGFEVMDKVLELLSEKGQPVQKPKLEGRFLMCLVEPIKE